MDDKKQSEKTYFTMSELENGLKSDPEPEKKEEYTDAQIVESTSKDVKDTSVLNLSQVCPKSTNDSIDNIVEDTEKLLEKDDSINSYMGKLRLLPQEDLDIVNNLIDNGLGSKNIMKVLEKSYPKIWKSLDGVSQPSLDKYRNWYESKKKVLKVIDQGGIIRTKDLMNAIDEMSERGDIDKYQLLKSVILLLAYKIKVLAEDSNDKDLQKILPSYIGELRQMVELTSKLSGELKGTEQTVVVNIVHGYLDGIYRAIYKAILSVCPQFINPLSAAIRREIKSYQTTIDKQENGKQNTK